MKKIHKPTYKKINKIGIVNENTEFVSFLFFCTTEVNKETRELFPSADIS